MMNSLKRARVALAALSTFVLPIAARSSTETRNAVSAATSGNGSPTSAAAGSTAANTAVDPCALLNQGDLAQFGQFSSGKPQTLGGARSCLWQRQDVPDGGSELVVHLDVRDGQGIKDVTDVGGGTQSATVNNRPAVRAGSPGSGDCTIALQLTDTSRVDVGISGVNDVNQSCQIASKVAYVVEPKLPKQ